MTKGLPATYNWGMKRALIAATLLGAAALVGAYAAGAFGGRTMPSFAPAPAHPLSVRTDLRLAKHVRCRGNYPRLVGPDVFSRFHAVTAVECVEGFRTYPGQGQWEVVSRKVAVSGIPNWQRYFEQPDNPNFPPKNAICTANLVEVLVPVFVDSQGQTLVPRTPVDRCGHPLGLAPGEKRIAVRWHTVWVHRIRQSISAPALAANCPMRWGNVVAEGEPKLRPGESFFTPTPHTVRACIYRAPANHIALGQFVRGKRLGPVQTHRLLRALTGSPTSGRCAKQRTFAMILGKGSSLGASVELGGCWRVAPGFRGGKPHTADAPVVSAILGRH
jgi:hypothetical protein